MLCVDPIGNLVHVRTEQQEITTSAMRDRGQAETRSGQTRAQWLEYADRLLAGVRPFASPGNSRITPPGAAGGYGSEIDGLEGFARTLLLAGFRIAGERGEGVDDLIDFYGRGIATGVDPAAPDRWVRLDEHPQAKVEAASMALILDMTRPWIWDRLDSSAQERVVDYLSPVVGDATYPRTNWLWFRLVVQTFLRSVGGPWSAQDIADDLALHDSLVREDGWISDGAERSFDHYAGWALHLYPVLWARMAGAGEFAASRTGRDVTRLDRFLIDALALVGGDGSPLIQGRSLTYRFAAAAPFWAGIIAEVPSSSAGALRHAAERVVGHFARAGVPDSRGLLSIGWHEEWRLLAQSYSGPASPYWAVKGLLGVALPADHPVWSAPDEPLPVEAGDTLSAVRAAGWLVSGTRVDGIVRVINHGTDHAEAGVLGGDSPLYARFGYSTATAPLLDDRAWREPLEQSVAIVRADGAATHRAGMELLDVRVDDTQGVGVAASTWTARWIVPRAHQTNHGSGIEGEAVPAGTLTAHSIVRGPWEVRIVKVDALEASLDPARLTLRVGGWAIADAEIGTMDAGSVVTAKGMSSSVQCLEGRGSPGSGIRPASTPLGQDAAVPFLTFPLEAGSRVVVLVELSGAPAQQRADVRFDESDVTITWPDAAVTTTALRGRAED